MLTTAAVELCGHIRVTEFSRTTVWAALQWILHAWWVSQKFKKLKKNFKQINEIRLS